MKYLDAAPDPRAVENLLERARLVATRPWTILEACGGQAHHLLRFGVDRALPERLTLRHGPCCPVCAMPAETIDVAVDLASRPGVVFCTPSDLYRAPGTRAYSCLAEARGPESEVRVVYSPLDALALARKHPDREVIFFACGHETTAPAAAAAVREADRLGLGNFSLLVAFRGAVHGIEAALAGGGLPAHAVLAAGQAATVTGLRPYEALARRARIPIVVIGPEPVDLLEGIVRALTLLEEGSWTVENQYARAVRPDGTPQARVALDAVFEPADVAWRGLGILPVSGLALRASYRRFDAVARFVGDLGRAPGGAGLELGVACRCGAIVAGRARPLDCPSFATGCSPERPLGAPMVSAEGVCAAYYRYRRARGAEPPILAPQPVLPAHVTPGRG